MRAHWLLLALAVCALACTPRTTPAPLAEAGAADAGVADSALAAAATPTPRRVLLWNGSICLADPKEEVLCARPDGDTLTFEPRPDTRGLVEASSRTPCWLRADHVALCDGREVGRNVRSVAGAPYLLTSEGRVIAAETQSTSAEHALRVEAARALPPLEGIAAGMDSTMTCGRAADGGVLCWAEPLFGFRSGVEVALLPVPARVPKLLAVEDLTLQPWLTLCARTREGAVLCSGAPAPRTDVCELRGKSDVRCGPQRVLPGGAGPAPLSEPSYDPRRALARAPEPVPGLDGADPATALMAWRLPFTGMLESERRLYLDASDEGGCALLRSGAVRCWERDPCRVNHPWRSADVAGLPRDVVRVALGTRDGHAVTRGGALYHWPRRQGPAQRAPDDCPDAAAFEVRAERVELPAPVFDVGGGAPWHRRAPGYEAIDCVTLTNGEARCWSRRRADAREVVRIELPHG